MYGIPVLGSDIGGIPELIQSGVTGKLFESGNADDLKTSVQDFWKLTAAENNFVVCDQFMTVDRYVKQLKNIVFCEKMKELE